VTYNHLNIVFDHHSSSVPYRKRALLRVKSRSL